MERKVSFNTASYIASLDFKHTEKPWSQVFPRKKVRDDMVKSKLKGNWKNGFIVKDTVEGFKYPFVDKNGVPRFEGLMHAFRRARMSVKHADDPVDKREAMKVMKIIIDVLEKWAKGKGPKAEFAKAKLEKYKESYKEARKAVKESSTYNEIRDALSEIALLTDLFSVRVSALGKHIPDLRKYRVALGKHPFGILEEAKKRSSPVEEDEVEQNKRYIKALYTHLRKSNEFKYADSPEEFVEYLTETKELLRSKDEFVMGMKKVSEMVIPVVGRLLRAEAMEPPAAIGWALKAVALAMEDLRKTKGILSEE